MKHLLLTLIVLALMAAGYGVFRNFEQHHRANNANAPRPMLLVYTHSSFMSPYGPGPEIAEEFSKICLCDVKYIDSGGGQVLFQKLKLAKNVDVVLGLDQASLKEAALYIKWRELSAHKRDWHPVFENNKYKTFLPYDWAPVTMVYKKSKELAGSESLESLLKSMPDKSLSLPDARQSSLGLQLAYWAFTEAGENLEKFTELASLIEKKTYKVSPDWSGSYGIFKRGVSPFVLSYMTSPLYHLKAEKDESYGAVEVNAGHPVHIEYAAVPDICRSCGLAKRFVEYLSSDRAQRLIYEKNYMLPVVNGILSEEEQKLVPEVKPIPAKGLDNFIDQKEEILSRWKLSAN